MNVESLQKQLDEKAKNELAVSLNKVKQDLFKAIGSVIGTNDLGSCGIRLEGKDFKVSIQSQLNEMFDGLKTTHLKSYQERTTKRFLESIEELKSKHETLEQIIGDLQQ